MKVAKSIIFKKYQLSSSDAIFLLVKFIVKCSIGKQKSPQILPTRENHYKRMLYFQSFLFIYEHRFYAYGEYACIITDLGETVSVPIYKTFLT